MRYPRHAFVPGCATKSWCVLPRKGSPTRTEILSREWWPMNDEPIIRLRPRKSKHGSNENPRKYTVFYDLCYASSRCRSGDKRRAAHIVQAGMRVRTVPLISAWPSESVTRRTRIQANGRPTEDTWPAKARRKGERLRRLDSLLPSRT